MEYVANHQIVTGAKDRSGNRRVIEPKQRFDPSDFDLGEDEIQGMLDADPPTIRLAEEDERAYVEPRPPAQSALAGSSTIRQPATGPADTDTGEL